MTTRVIDNLLVRVGYEVDEASRRRAANSLQNMQRTLQSFSVGMAAAGTAVTAVTTKAVTTFAGQQATFAKIEGLVGVARSEIEKMIPAVDKLAVATGVGPQKLADALFYVTSAGYRGAEALDILAASARAEVAGLGQAAQVADLATSAINAYGSENLSAADAMDQLAMAVRLGKLETESIAPVIGSVLPLASRLQVPLKDALGILAAMSRTGTDAAEGATQLSSVMSQLIKPSQAGEDLIFERLGMNMDEVRAAVAERGLLPVLGMLEESVDGNVQLLGDLFNNVRALRGVLDLLGPNAQATTEIMEGMAEAEGTLNEAFEINVRTLKGQYGRVMAATAVLWKNLGEAMAPVVEDKLVRAIARLSELTDWFKEQPEWFKQGVGWLALLGPALLGAGLGASLLSTALGGLKLILAPVLGLFAGLSLPVWAFIAALVALWFGIVWIWGPQIEEAWDKLKEAFIDPLIAEIKTWWDEKMWPAIQKAWEEQDFEPIIAAILTLWNDILWPAIQKAWEKLKEKFIDPIIAKIELWWEKQEWLTIEWWWNHLRNVLNPILAFVGIDIPTLSEIKTKLTNLWNQIKTWWTGVDAEGNVVGDGVKNTLPFGLHFVPPFLKSIWDTIVAWWTGADAEKGAEGSDPTLPFGLHFVPPFLKSIWDTIVAWWTGADAEKGAEGSDPTLPFGLHFVPPFLKNIWATIVAWWTGADAEKGAEGSDPTLPFGLHFVPPFLKSIWDTIVAWWTGADAEKGAEGSDPTLPFGLHFVPPFLKNIWATIVAWWTGADAEKGAEGSDPTLPFGLHFVPPFLKSIWDTIVAWWTGADAEKGAEGSDPTLPFGLHFVPPFLKSIWDTIVAWWTGADAEKGAEGSDPTLPFGLHFVPPFLKNIWATIVAWWTGADAEKGAEGSDPTLPFGLHFVPPVLSNIWQSVMNWWAGKNTSTDTEGTERKLPVGFKLPTWAELQEQWDNLQTDAGNLAGSLAAGAGISLAIKSIVAAKGASAIGVARVLGILKSGTAVGLTFTVVDILTGGSLSGWVVDLIKSTSEKPEVQIAINFFKSNWNEFLQNLGIGGTNEDGTEKEGISVEVTPTWIADPIKHLTDSFNEKLAGYNMKVVDGNLQIEFVPGYQEEVPGPEAMGEAFLEGWSETVTPEDVGRMNEVLAKLVEHVQNYALAAAGASLYGATFTDELLRLIGILSGGSYLAAVGALETLESLLANIWNFGALIFAEKLSDDPDSDPEVKRLRSRLHESMGVDYEGMGVDYYDSEKEFLEANPNLPTGTGVENATIWDRSVHSMMYPMTSRENIPVRSAGENLRTIGRNIADGLLDLLPTGGISIGLGPSINYGGQETELEANPYLDQDEGGISIARTLRWLSYNNRPEAIIPLHRFDEVMRPFMNQMMPAMAGGSGTVEINQRVGDINVNVAGSGGDAHAIAREVGAEVRKQFRDLADEMDSAIRR